MSNLAAFQVVFQGQRHPKEDPDTELVLGPYEQGVVIEDYELKDAATGEKIADQFVERAIDMADWANIFGHPATAKWCIPRSMTAGVDSEEDIIKVQIFDRCYVQAVLPSSEA